MILGLDNLLISFLWSIIIVFEYASSFASHMHELQKEISDKIAQNNVN